MTPKNYIDSECHKRLEQRGFFPCEASVYTSMPTHCSEVNKRYSDMCREQYEYWPISTAQCYSEVKGEYRYFPLTTLYNDCFKLQVNEPENNWNIKECYCCCWCFANNTLIDMSEGKKEIKDIQFGEKIIVGSIDKSASSNLSWNEDTITFSAGTDGGIQPAMMYIVFGNKEEIIVSCDHVFLLSTGKFITAERLQPGDELVDKNGKPLPILTASIGQYEGGLHHIAANVEFDGSVDGHMIIAAGVVSGDYTLQVNFDKLSDDMIESGWEERTIIGTAGHLNKFRDAMEKGIFYFQNIDFVPANKAFKVYQIEENELPNDAQTFLTVEQANSLWHNPEVVKYPLKDSIAHGSAKYAIKLVSSFYPDIDFLLDWENMNPNVYSYEKYEKKIVVISGGFARLSVVNIDILVFAICHCAANFTEKTDKKPIVSTFLADYGAITLTRRIFYFDTWFKNVVKMHDKLISLFGYISKEYSIDLDCRIQSVESGMVGGELPVCAGGPDIKSFYLQEVNVIEGGIELIFSMDIDKENILNDNNYLLSPQVDITEIKKDDKKGFKLFIYGEFENKIYYEIKIKNLISSFGTKLDESLSVASFYYTY